MEAKTKQKQSSHRLHGHSLPSRYKTEGTEAAGQKLLTPPSPSPPHSFPRATFPQTQASTACSVVFFLLGSPVASCFLEPLSSSPKSLSESYSTSPRHRGFLDCWRRAMLHGGRPLSLRGSLKALEADIHHANTLAHAIHRAYGGTCVQMRLSYSSMAPIILNLIQWMDCSCSLSYTLPSYLGLLEVLVYKVYVDGDASISTIERRASLKEFYAIIYPYLQQIEENVMAKECKEKGWCKGDGDSGGRRKLYADDKDAEREDECGICLETCTKMVLPNCNHAMCINCYRDWYTRSQSCPFCRGSLKRVQSRDLWVLTGDEDVIDPVTLEKENVRHFHSFIDSLPLIVPDNLLLVYYDYLV